MDLEQIFQKIGPFTCIGRERQFNLAAAVMNTYEERISGCLIECGTWKCGSVGLMTLVDDTLGSTREIHGFDSFEGLPEPTPEDGSGASGWGGALKIYHSDALNNLKGMGAERAILHKGFFEETLPEFKKTVSSIAVLRLDGDWYSSTMTVFNELYDLVSPGGYVIVDDYGHWEGCKKATDEFREIRKISTPLNKTDYTEFWWRKE